LGKGALTRAGFSLATHYPLVFTEADISTTLASYIFAGHSLFGPIISTTPPPNGPVLIASDDYDVPNSGIMLGSGATVGLGRSLFNVTSSATNGAFPVTLNSSQTTLADFVGNDVPITTLNDGSITITASPTVPEPSSVILFGIGLGTSLLGYVYRRRHHAT
jgi:hypothetical protein